MDSLPTNLRDLQGQLNAAIRAHRNLVGRSNLCPQDAGLQQKVQAAERLIIRIFHAQKPLLAQYRKDCQGKSAMESVVNGNFKVQVTVDEALEDGVRHHFCPSTLDRLASSVGSMSPEKKRKVNFLTLFDLVTPKLSDDIADWKSPHRKRKHPLVNADFPLVGPLLDPGCKRLRGSNAGARPEVGGHGATPRTVPSPSQGILTRSSRRAARIRAVGAVSEESAAAAAAAAAADKSPGSASSETRQQSDSEQTRFCCASCHRVLPETPDCPAAPVARCPECRTGGDSSRACGVIGLPPETKFEALEVSSKSSASVESLEAVELENKSLLREAHIWERNLLSQEQVRQRLVKKNCRIEKKLESLLANFSKVNGM